MDSLNNRGQEADRPKEIPARGWKDVLVRVKDQFTEDHIGIVAAGVAFYFFLALFPLISAMVSIYGLVFDPSQVEQHLSQLGKILPPQAFGVIGQQLHKVAGSSNQGLGLTLLVSIVLSLWSANSGTKALFDGINIAYNQKEERNFIKLNGISLAITLGSIFIGLIAVALVIGFPALIDKIGLPSSVSTIISLVRWPILFVIVVISIAAIYKFAPDRDNPKFRWVSWGAAVAATLWIGGSLLFSLYINNFSNYDATYGAVAAVIILMLWFQLTSLCVLLGAEINSELEHQTAKDTTVGQPEPLGKRGGYYADHVAGQNDNEITTEDDQNLKDQKPKKSKNRSKDRDSVRLEQWFRSKNKDRKTK